MFCKKNTLKRFLILMCMFTIMPLGTGLKAEETTITLCPGWNWISCPKAVSIELDEAFGNFTPREGDKIRSQLSSSYYRNGQWRGGVTHFEPGCGYMYFSTHSESVSLVFAQTSSSVVSTATPTNITFGTAEVGGTVTLPEGSHVFQRGVCWDTAQSPDIEDSHTSEGTGLGNFSCLLEDLISHTTYYVRAYVVGEFGLVYGDELSFTTLGDGGDDHEYVDLGLPSGLLWATCNIGADYPEDYGEYFAWGETQSKGTYSWNTYQHCNGSENTLTKYCSNANNGNNGFTDNLTILQPNDDAATTSWGSDWRMPTKEEWQELYDNTTCIWTTQNGVCGRLFTASNGNSLFVPAAGYHTGNRICHAGRNGYYWLNSLFSNNSNIAWSFNFQAGGCYMVNYRARHHGQSVRAVRIEAGSQNNTLTGIIDGKFTINSNGDQVYFSQGNLQYIGSASSPYWKFADNQWDYFGKTTGQNSNNINVDRDLFGWGTSGWNNGNTCYRPWDTYYLTGSVYGPIGENNLTGTFANADWGVYNRISNGGNQPNQWRTLTAEEWVYVFNTRTTSSGIRYAMAKVNNVNGVILLPDDWNASYHTLCNTNNSGVSYISNVITATEWGTMEQLGAVFLPAAGYRNGTTVSLAGSFGNYWSTTNYHGYYAHCLYFYNSSLSPQVDSGRAFGLSVRLVRPIQ